MRAAPFCAVTFTVMSVWPIPRPTWWPAAVPSASAGKTTVAADVSVAAAVTVTLSVSNGTDAVYDVVPDANAGLSATSPNDSELNDGSLSSDPSSSVCVGAPVKALANETCSSYRDPVVRPVSESRSTLPAFCRGCVAGQLCPDLRYRQYNVDPSVFAM